MRLSLLDQIIYVSCRKMSVYSWQENLWNAYAYNSYNLGLWKKKLCAASFQPILFVWNGSNKRKSVRI